MIRLRYGDSLDDGASLDRSICSCTGLELSFGQIPAPGYRVPPFGGIS